MYNLLSATDHELTKCDMESVEIIFRNIESLLQRFSYDINEYPFLLVKQLVCSYHNMVLEFLSVNHNLQSEFNLLKKTNVHLIYNVNMHRMTANSDTPPDRTIWCFI